MFVVTGATGNTGSVVADTLLQQGKQVKVVLRDNAKADGWKAKGAEVAIADMGDSAALAAALKGAEGAYILVPPLYGAPDFLAAMAKLSDSIAAAINTSGVPHIVMLSSVGAQHAEGIGPIRNLHYAESIIPQAAPNATVLRASYFIENYAPVLGAAVGGGVLPSFFPADFRIPMNATLDIGRIAADLLLHPAKRYRLIEMSGPEDYSPADIAAVLTTLLGKPIKVLALPLAAVVPEFMKMGMSEAISKLFAEMYAGILDGHVAAEGAGEFRHGTVTAQEVLAKLLKATSATS
jgi:NAD(P)H dehydrogenase (quinone)